MKAWARSSPRCRGVQDESVSVRDATLALPAPLDIVRNVLLRFHSELDLALKLFVGFS